MGALKQTPHAAALAELGLEADFYGEEPEIAPDLMRIYSSWWEMRAFCAIEDALSIDTIATWMRAHGIEELIAAWLPCLRAMEDERRAWLVEMRRNRETEA